MGDASISEISGQKKVVGRINVNLKRGKLMFFMNNVIQQKKNWSCQGFLLYALDLVNKIQFFYLRLVE